MTSYFFFDGYQHGDSVTVAAMIEKIHATVRFDHLDEISVYNRGEHCYLSKCSDR